MVEVREREVRARADVLAREGDPGAGVDLLLRHRLLDDARALAEAQVVELSAQARFADVVGLAGRLPRPDRPLAVRCAEIDARAHTEGARTADIEQVIDAARAAGRPELTAWAGAVLADHLLLEGDLTCVVAAGRFLAELPDDPLPPALLLQARGRLRRILALAHLASGPSHEPQARHELQRAIADFRRASWHTQRWISVSLYHLFQVAVSWSAPQQVVHAVIEARDQLLALGSPQVHFARYAVAFAAYSNGDCALIAREQAELAAMHLTGEPAALPALADNLEALCEAVLSGRPRAIERLNLADGVRRSAPSMTGVVLVKATHALLDLGRPQEAAQWYGRLLATPAILPYEGVEREILAGRLAVVQGDASVLPRMVAALDQVAAISYPRVVAGLTLRCAMDAARAGHAAEAAALREQAETLLPPEFERNGWERFWLRSVTEALSQDTGADPDPGPNLAGSTAGDRAWTSRTSRTSRSTRSTRALRVLVPAVEVTVDGGRRRLAPGVARLLVSLTAFGRAVGAEELALVLWGDVDPALARGRLKSALHRLRQALSLEADELVVRDGDVVRLVPDPRWTIDLVDFRRWATGSGEQQLRAFRMVDGLLCQAQFPYHDELARERTVLAAGWSQLARTLLGRGLVAPEEVRLRARHLGLEEFRA